MCKEVPVIPVDRVVDKTTIIGKMEGQGGVEAQGVADPKNKESSLTEQLGPDVAPNAEGDPEEAEADDLLPLVVGGADLELNQSMTET
jgi:hypothetical protein